MKQPDRIATQTRREFLRTAGICATAVIGTVLLSSACAPQAPAVSTATFSVGAELATVDPHNETNAQAAGVRRHMFEMLVDRDESLNIIPLLATSWRRVNATTWEFKLRDGVKFHDGSTMTANDVKFSFDRILDKSLNLRARPFIASVDHVDVVDPLTVNVVTAKPDPILINRLSSPAIAVLPAESFQKLGPDKFMTAPIGTGPYKFVEWVKDDHLKMEAFAGHWSGKSKIDQVIHKPILEGATRIAALKTGAADLVAYVEPQQVDEIKSDSKLDVVFVRSPRVYMVVMNTLKKPFDDVRVRQAMNYAVDVDAIIKDLMSGRGQRLPGIIGPDWGMYDPSQKPYPYDPNKAKQLLADAGYPNGFEVTLGTPRGRYLFDVETAQAVAGYLGKVGVKINVEAAEFGNFMARVLDYNKGSNPYTMLYIGYGGSILDIDDMLQAFFDPKRRGSYFNDAKTDDLIARGLEAPDPEARKAIYKELQAYIYDQAPWIFGFNLNDTFGINKRVKDWKPRGDEVVLLNKASVS